MQSSCQICQRRPRPFAITTTVSEDDEEEATSNKPNDDCSAGFKFDINESSKDISLDCGGMIQQSPAAVKSPTLKEPSDTTLLRLTLVSYLL